ncbi:MAG: hypothetical protein NTU80_03150 [Verrucomicrobia bacterium]|nr:hypothetical protein [Verrucomicrobiota bacterium]
MNVLNVKHKSLLFSAMLLSGITCSQSVYAGQYDLETDPATLAQKCGSKAANSLWNALNEFASILPVGKAYTDLFKAGTATSKVLNKEISTELCSMNMANLINIMTLVAKKEIYQNDLRNLTAQWQAAQAEFNRLGNDPDTGLLLSVAGSLNTIEAECSTKDFRIKPVFLGVSLLKLMAHRLLVESANKSFDDANNTNSARYYMACVRAMGAADDTMDRLQKINQSLIVHTESIKYSIVRIPPYLDDQHFYAGIITYPDGTTEHIAEGTCIYNPLFPADRDKLFKQLQEEGADALKRAKYKLITGESNTEYRKIYQQQEEVVAKIRAFGVSISEELNSRNEAYRKKTTGGDSSMRAVNGYRSDGNALYSFRNGFNNGYLNWEVDLGKIWEPCPTKIESVAFRAVLSYGAEGQYIVQLLDENRNIVEGRRIGVSHTTTDYVVNFRAYPFGVGKAPVARYVRILCPQSSSPVNAYKFNLDEVYVFTADIGATLQMTSVITSAVPYAHTYFVQLINSENQTVASKAMSFSGDMDTRFWEVPINAKYAKFIRITSTVTNQPVSLYHVRIFKRGEFAP